MYIILFKPITNYINGVLITNDYSPSLAFVIPSADFSESSVPTRFLMLNELVFLGTSAVTPTSHPSVPFTSSRHTCSPFNRLPATAPSNSPRRVVKSIFNIYTGNTGIQIWNCLEHFSRIIWKSIWNSFLFPFYLHFEFGIHLIVYD